MSITIDADDPRTIRAIELAAEADHWLSGYTRAGEPIFGIESQREPGRYYIVTRAKCDCPDFRERAVTAPAEQACKHVLAVRLHTELVRAQQARPSGGHGQRRHLTLLGPSAPGASTG